MTAYRFIVLAVCAAFAACAQQPVAQDEAAGPQVMTAKPEPRLPPLPNVELSEELLYRMMLAEVALQRGQPHIAVQTYLELARETRDPRIAQRATEVAWNARFSSAALEAAGIWLQADPGSAQARQREVAAGGEQLLLRVQHVDVDAHAHFVAELVRLERALARYQRLFQRADLGDAVGDAEKGLARCERTAAAGVF